MQHLLNEDKRSELLNKSKHADNYAPNNQFNGKNRYERRLKSKVANSVREFNSINMNQLFKDSILTVDVKVRGETSDYLVKIRFGNILEHIHEQLTRTNGKLELRTIARALTTSFNSDDVYVRCQCEDFLYRFSYWTKVNDISSAPELEQTNNGREIVNPYDSKGAGCKHILLVLSNNSWLIKVSSTIYNYINYMEKHQQRLYADVIYPAIYEKDYEEPVQLTIDDVGDDADSNVLDTSSDDIDTSNKWARTKNQFKKGNQSGIQFAPKETEAPEKQFDFDSLMSDTTES